MNSKEEIRILLYQLCSVLGICDPLYDLEKFLSKEHYDADQFAREVFLAEGINPDSQLQLFRQVKRMFTARFGAGVDL